MMKKEAARLCGNARTAGQFALQEQEKYGIVKKQIAAAFLTESGGFFTPGAPWA